MGYGELVVVDVFDGFIGFVCVDVEMVDCLVWVKNYIWFGF